jgi:hypothetical protein
MILVRLSCGILYEQPDSMATIGQRDLHVNFFDCQRKMRLRRKSYKTRFRFDASDERDFMTRSSGLSLRLLVRSSGRGVAEERKRTSGVNNNQDTKR